MDTFLHALFHSLTRRKLHSPISTHSVTSCVCLTKHESVKPPLHPQQTRSSHWPRLSSDALCDAIPAPLPRIHQHSAPVTATPARAPPLVHHPSRASHVTSEAPEEPPLLSPPPRDADGQLAWSRPRGCEVQGQGVFSLRSRSVPGFHHTRRRLTIRLPFPGTRSVFFFSVVFFFSFVLAALCDL